MKLFITRIVLALRNFQQWLVAQVMFGFLNFLKLFPADGAIRFADRMMRRLGRRTRRHRLMLTNLRNAFPEKSEAEIEVIALDSWGNMGRLAAISRIERRAAGQLATSSSRAAAQPKSMYFSDLWPIIESAVFSIL